MMPDGSVTHWIERVKSGDHDAAGQLWERYFGQLVRLARQRLKATRSVAVDGEDVALSAFDSFCRGAERGRFPDLADRDSLWRLIARITVCKVISQRRRETRQRRGGGRELSETDVSAGNVDDPGVLASVVGNEPGPEFVAMLTEQVERLLGLLGDGDLRQLAIGKMEGFSNAEMAERLDCSIRTVERRLCFIREKYEQDGLHDVET